MYNNIINSKDKLLIIDFDRLDKFINKKENKEAKKLGKSIANQIVNKIKKLIKDKAAK